MRLLQTKKNAIGLELERLGFDLAEFEWRDTFGRKRAWLDPGGDRVVEMLAHRPSGSLLVFDYSDGAGVNPPCWCIHREPGLKNEAEVDHPREIDGAAESVRKWGIAMKRELAAPDLFALAAAGSTLSTATGAPEGVPFSPDEATTLGEKLDRIERTFAERMGAHEEHLRDLKEQIEFLKRAAKTSSRGVWYRAAAHTLMALASHLPDLAAAREALGWAWRLLASGDEPPMIGG